MSGADVGPRAPCFGPHNLALARAVPRCGARTRDGSPCRGPAVRDGRRCRMHGGLSTGPRTAAGKERARLANWRHGGRTAEATAERAAALAVRRRVLAILRRLREPSAGEA